MAMQTKVGLYPVTGFPGQEVNPGSAIYTAENYISDGTLTAGAFAFTSARPEQALPPPSRPQARPEPLLSALLSAP